ncbi:hypothetical protein [Pararhodospirillum oryzae]|uniref:Heme exporter protein D n=1 Tax=Pararhodospirillum oryzae TaxID=478448 RepID=A0A512H8B6_9PROT|nr:hypothetical protein [Pararhodospirillum oryzae]GEO81668.1 hypothetical protein ROR02_17990 [Pararhodospirillum oryzae]
MMGEHLALAELTLVLGGALGLCVWQLISIRRTLARDRARRDKPDA